MKTAKQKPLQDSASVKLHGELLQIKEMLENSIAGLQPAILAFSRLNVTVSNRPLEDAVINIIDGLKNAQLIKMKLDRMITEIDEKQLETKNA